MGGKGAAKGKGKGSKSSAGTVVKPWQKSSGGYESSRGYGGHAKSFSSGAAPVAPWKKGAATSSSSSRSYGAGGYGAGGYSTRDRKGGKSKGKGKEKGKKKGAAPKNSQFWVRKQEEENREVVDSEPLRGVVERYIIKAGWGFIMPDNPDSLPQQVRDTLKEATEKLRADGKDPGDENLLYFRKPDVQKDFKINKDSEVIFQVYTDNKGVGACEVKDPDAPEGEEADGMDEEAAGE